MTLKDTWMNMPEDVNSSLYTHGERAAYYLIKDNPSVDQAFKVNPVAAAEYITHCYMQIQQDALKLYPDRDKVIVRRLAYLRGEDVYTSSYFDHCVEEKTSLRKYAEREYIRAATGELNLNQPLYYMGRDLRRMLNENRFLNDLWQFMYEQGLVDNDLDSDSSDTVEEFFHACQIITYEEYDHFIDLSEYTEHEEMDLRLLFNGSIQHL